MTMTDKERAQAYLELAGFATEGPWREGHGAGEYRRVNSRHDTVAECGWSDDNANFIAASRIEGPYFAQKFLDALDEIERLRKLDLYLEDMQFLLERSPLIASDVTQTIHKLAYVRQTLEGSDGNA